MDEPQHKRPRLYDYGISPIINNSIVAPPITTIDTPFTPPTFDCSQIQYSELGSFPGSHVPYSGAEWLLTDTIQGSTTPFDDIFADLSHELDPRFYDNCESGDLTTTLGDENHQDGDSNTPGRQRESSSEEHNFYTPPEICFGMVKFSRTFDLFPG